MGKCVKVERSMDNQFQFSLWDNGEDGHIVEIRRFAKTIKNSVQFNRFQKMTFTPAQFENFKKWIKTFERKKTKQNG